MLYLDASEPDSITYTMCEIAIVCLIAPKKTVSHSSDETTEPVSKLGYYQQIDSLIDDAQLGAWLFDSVFTTLTVE